MSNSNLTSIRRALKNVEAGLENAGGILTVIFEWHPGYQYTCEQKYAEAVKALVDGTPILFFHRYKDETDYKLVPLNNVTYFSEEGGAIYFEFDNYAMMWTGDGNIETTEIEN